MKKLLLIAAVLLCALPAFTLYRGDEIRDGVYSISSADFSEETTQVLNALGDNIAFYDYRVDSSVKSFSVDIWLCENGVWENSGSVCGNLDGRYTGRIGIRYDAAGCKIIIMDKDGHTSHTSFNGVDFSGVTSTGKMKIGSGESWTLNEETVLLVETGTNESEFRTFSMEEFRESGCEVGVAFTLTFSDQLLA